MITNLNQALRVIEQNPDIFEGLHDPGEFMNYLRKNMHVVVVFSRYAHKLRHSGKREHYSARAIIHRLRWDSYFADVDSQYKIGNNSTPFLARLVMAEDPALEGLFRLRNTKEAV